MSNALKSRSTPPLIVIAIALSVFIGGILWGLAGSREKEPEPHKSASGKLQISASPAPTLPR